MNRLQIGLRSMGLLSFCIISIGCASAPKYKPAEGNEPGYRSLKVSENKYVVTYKGTDSSSKNEVESFILYRAAELTKAHGFDYFVVKLKDRDVYRELGPSKAPSTLGQFVPGAPEFPYFANGFPWVMPVATSVDSQAEQQFEAMAFISMHKGSIPNRQPTSAYRAVEVLESLKEKVD